jgi:hypothetical protein
MAESLLSQNPDSLVILPTSYFVKPMAMFGWFTIQTKTLFRSLARRYHSCNCDHQTILQNIPMVRSRVANLGAE